MALQQVAGGGDQVVDLDRDMTFEEKASLSAGINRLTSNNLAKVVQIIKENMPSLGAGSEEIESSGSPRAKDARQKGTSTRRRKCTR